MLQVESVWLTGATGFIGSNMLAYLLKLNLNVIATVREQSDLWRIQEFQLYPNLTILKYEDEFFEDTIIKNKPTVIIHSAWGGLSVASRNNWDIQFENIQLTYSVLVMAKKVGIKKFIALGSQAEYGFFSGRIDENYPCNPNTAYGAAKIATFQIVKQFCKQNNIEWYWLRLFSMFGKNEDNNWLITSVTNSILNGNEIKLTYGEQLYDYVNMNFLTDCIFKVVNDNSNNTGLYNLGSNGAISIKAILLILSTKLKEYNPKLNFGALDYRQNQVMHMEGDSSKFYNTFGVHQKINLEEGLDEIIADLKNKMK